MKKRFRRSITLFVLSAAGAFALASISYSSLYRQQNDFYQYYHSNWFSEALFADTTSNDEETRPNNKGHAGSPSDRAATQQAISKNSTSVPLHPLICNDPPNIGDPDYDALRYNVLRRIQHYRDAIAIPSLQNTSSSSASSIRLLCVLPFFSEAVEQAALDTYVQECDGALVLRQTSNHSSSAVATTSINTGASSSKSQHEVPVEILYLDAHSSHWQTKLVKYFEINPKLFTWVVWASPDRYPVIAFMRYALQKESAIKSPSIMESWLLRHPWDFKYPRGIKTHKRDCSIGRMWSWDASRQILSSCNTTRQALVNSSSLVHDLNTTNVMECPLSVNLPCLKIQTPPSSNWLIVLLRYHEIFLPRPWRQIERVHAILNGVCDAYWDRGLGALDADFKEGYIHDPFYLRKHPPKFDLHPDNGEGGVCGLPLGKGDEGEWGAKGLLKIQTNESVSGANYKKVLCLVYTHKERHDQLSAIAETWGPKCDGYLAASTLTNISLGAVNLLHEGVEDYSNMWMKVVAMFKYAHRHYRDEFDFYHIGGDDMYVIAENLRHTVATGSWKETWDQEKPLFLGGSIGLTARSRFCGGGSGYTLNSKALDLFIDKLYATPDCRPHYHGSQEDRFISECFQSVGIRCMDTNDEKLEARYHPMTVDYHAAWNTRKPMLGWKSLQSSFHNITYLEGLGQISETSVSFHLKTKAKVHDDVGMRRYHAILYGLCPSDSPLGKSIIAVRRESSH